MKSALIITLILALGAPLLILNVLGEVVSGIWLAFLGDWGAIGTGFALSIISSLLLGLICAPSLFLVQLAMSSAEKGDVIGRVFWDALGSLYVHAVVTVWCYRIFLLFVDEATDANLTPRLIWSYGVAVGPWAYMAYKERGGGGELLSSITSSFALLAYLTLMVFALFSSVTDSSAITMLAAFMFISWAVQVVVVSSSGVTALGTQQPDGGSKTPSQVAVEQRQAIRVAALNGDPSAKDINDILWSVEQLDPDHQFLTGAGYALGIGTEVDLGKGFVWLSLAAASGHQAAIDLLDKIKPAMTPEQLKAAEEMTPYMLEYMTRKRAGGTNAIMKDAILEKLNEKAKIDRFSAEVSGKTQAEAGIRWCKNCRMKVWKKPDGSCPSCQAMLG